MEGMLEEEKVEEKEEEKEEVSDSRLQCRFLGNQ